MKRRVGACRAGEEPRDPLRSPRTAGGGVVRSRAATIQVSDESRAARERIEEEGGPLFLGDWERTLMVHFEVGADVLDPFVPFPLDLHRGSTRLLTPFLNLRTMSTGVVSAGSTSLPSGSRTRWRCWPAHSFTGCPTAWQLSATATRTKRAPSGAASPPPADSTTTGRWTLHRASSPPPPGASLRSSWSATAPSRSGARGGAASGSGSRLGRRHLPAWKSMTADSSPPSAPSCAAAVRPAPAIPPG